MSDQPSLGSALLILAGEKDNTAPGAIAHASYERQKRNPAVTEYAVIENRGHGLTVDDGWREVADVSLDFVRRFVEPEQAQPTMAAPPQLIV